VLLAAVSAVLAMLTFRLRKFPTLDPQALRRYLAAGIHGRGTLKTIALHLRLPEAPGSIGAAQRVRAR